MHHFALQAQHHTLVTTIAVIAALAAGLILAITVEKLAGTALRIHRGRARATATRQERARALGCRPSQLRRVERIVNRSRRRH
jgi:hypothetical protein